jgi:hypothetical protein
MVKHRDFPTELLGLSESEVVQLLGPTDWLPDDNEQEQKKLLRYSVRFMWPPIPNWLIVVLRDDVVVRVVLSNP